MDRFRRYAVYYVPRDGDFAQAAAAWLGWDLARGRAVAQPDLPGLAALTAAPRAYGFHGTLKPPFRLAPGTDAGALDAALAGLAGRLPVAGADRLRLGGELAVRDIRALLSVLATPEDDLSLACVLRSPLGGLDEDALFKLAARRPDLVRFERWHGARHCKEWNIDPQRWERVVREFLSGL